MEIANAAAVLWVVAVIFAAGLLLYLALRKPTATYVTSADQWFYLNLGSTDSKPLECYIGAYADYFRYDPDGIAGPPTPKDPDLEDWMFGKGMMQIIREKQQETNA